MGNQKYTSNMLLVSHANQVVHCHIRQSTLGWYVKDDRLQDKERRVPTIECAYAVCHELNKRVREQESQYPET
jgi:hypothetical protein